MNYLPAQTCNIVIPVPSLISRYHMISGLHDINHVLGGIVELIDDTEELSTFNAELYDAMEVEAWERGPDDRDEMWSINWDKVLVVITEVATELWMTVKTHPLLANKSIKYGGTTADMGGIIINVHQ